MVLFGGILSVKAVTFLTFCVFGIAAFGYLLGKITIKGVNLGTAGVFIVALLFGCFLYAQLKDQLVVDEVSYVKNALKIIENMGLVLFVSDSGGECTGEAEYKLAQTIANFLGRHMEA